MTSPACYGSFRLERIRFALLDPDTLAPSPGANHGYVIDSQTVLNVGDVNETGDTVTVKNGGGRICVDAQDDDTFKRVALQLSVCSRDPLVEYFLMGARLFRDDSARIVGAQTPVAGSATNQPICIEAWSRAWDGTSQAISPTTSPELSYWHWVFPYSHGFTMQAVDLGNAGQVFQYNGLSDDNPAITLNGPFNDWPSYLADEGGVVGARGYFLDTAPPDATCAMITVPAGS